MEYTTLNILKERVIRGLSGGDIPEDSPYKDEFVIEYIRDAMNADLEMKILQKRGGDEDDKSYVSQYIATYPNIAVEIESSTKRVFAELPGYFLSLKHNRGIHSVHRQAGENKSVSLVPMIRVHNPGVSINLPHSNYEGTNFGYYLEGMRVYWMRDIIRDGVSHVCIKLLIAAPNSIGLDDPLPILPESIGRILDIVTQRTLNRVVQDRINDNNPNIRAINQ
jgi:hypothetical protein